jgi:hypothetical protein
MTKAKNGRKVVTVDLSDEMNAGPMLETHDDGTISVRSVVEKPTPIAHASSSNRKVLNINDLPELAPRGRQPNAIIGELKALNVGEAMEVDQSDKNCPKSMPTTIMNLNKKMLQDGIAKHFRSVKSADGSRQFIQCCDGLYTPRVKKSK